MSVHTPTDTTGTAETEEKRSDRVDEAEEASSDAPDIGQWLEEMVGRARRSARVVRREFSGGTWYHHRRALAVLAVLLVIVPAVIAYVVANGRSEVFLAESEVLFSVEEAFVDEATSETLALIGRSDRVLAPVADDAGLSLEELKDSVGTSVVDTTTVVAVDVRRDDPDEAARLAASIAEKWVDTARRPVTPATTGVVALIGAQTTRLGELEAELTASGLPTEARVLFEEERDAVVAQIGALEEQLSALEGEDLFLGHKAEILAPAKAEEQPVEPKPLQAAIAGGVIGVLLAGALLALAWQLTLRE